jgi:hypothetical protein
VSRAQVGNIYRAEILLKSGVHPNILGQQLSREEYARVWGHSVKLLRRGFECGSILTVDPEEAKALNKPEARRYIYNQKNCVRCGSTVQSWDMAGRTCYACVSCQPTHGRAQMPPDVAQGKVFISHCAEEDAAVRALSPEKLLVKELRDTLKQMGLDTAGKKQDLVDRILAARKTADQSSETGNSATSSARQAPDMLVNAKGTMQYQTESDSSLSDSILLEVPGTLVPAIASASFARKEKVLAGESRAVEHVAEYDTTAAGSVVDWTDLEGDHDKKRKTATGEPKARAKRKLALP